MHGRTEVPKDDSKQKQQQFPVAERLKAQKKAKTGEQQKHYTYHIQLLHLSKVSSFRAAAMGNEYGKEANSQS